MSLGKISKTNGNIVFKGYDKYLNKKGEEVHSFYYPHSDDYNLQLEILPNPKGKEITEDTNVMAYDIKNKSLDIQLQPGMDNFYDIYYRFKLTDKNNPKKQPIYVIDDGLVADDLGKVNGSSSPFNQIFADRKIVSKTGIMQLQMPDMYYPGVEYKDGKYVINNAKRARAISSVKNHFNSLGGTLNGMAMKIPEKAKEGYTRIVGTPFTKDEISSHLYWTQNAYQMASSVGTLQDMKRFQQTLFRNGMNFVSDAALVNEGLQGIHFASLMKWGKDSPFYTWFKTFGLDSNNINIGVIPENSENVRMKIINSPIALESNPVQNKTYDPKKPTYVQLYDARLVSDELEKSDTVFTKYDRNIPNHHEVTSYDDAVIPYSFEVNPSELVKNIKKYNATGKDAFKDTDKIKQILNFSNFKIGDREAGGVELWDGNVDITKLNFAYGNFDTELLNNDSKFDINKRIAQYKQGIREVQDYAVLSGKYWTKLSADTQLEYAANAFKNVKTKNDAVNKVNENIGLILPKNVTKFVDEEIIGNTLSGKYKLFKLNNLSTVTLINKEDKKQDIEIKSYSDFVKKSIMNVPLETLETSNNVLSILSSGYLSKRAATDEQIGLTRFDIYKSNYPNLSGKYADLYKRTDNFLANDVYKFVDKVISSYEKFGNSEKIRDGNNATTFGKYAINAVVPDLVKFALLKALDADANIIIEQDGSLNFDNVDKEKLSVINLGLSADKPILEANNLIKKLEKGVGKLNSNQNVINELSRAVATRLSGLNENSFKLADMVIDRTESGMGLRVDASKDVAEFDSVRNGVDDVASAWNDVIKFWSKYVKEGVQKENQHAYTTAEVTDIPDFVGEYSVGALKSAPAADREMLQKVGVTSIANYAYLFSMPTGVYSMNPETGDFNGFENISNIKSKMDCLDNPDWRDNKGYIYEGMPDASIHSYTFVGNHDKPRILHVLGLDMKLFNSRFNDISSINEAAEVLGLNSESLNEVKENIKFCGPAIAMGKRLRSVFADMANPEKGTPYITSNQLNQIYKAISCLASGKYVYPNGYVKDFDPVSFGTKPFDVAINDVLAVANLPISNKDRKVIKDKALENMLAPAMEKFKSIYKMLTLLPGDMTDFAGDKEGMTGYESISKNKYQQNRNAVKWEWIDPSSSEYKPLVARFNNEINEIMALRKRPELSALCNGHTVSLVNYHNGVEYIHSQNRQYSANLRYNKEGSMVFTIFGKPDLGSVVNPHEGIGNGKVNIEYLNLSSARSREGLRGGLQEGMVFMNANQKDTTKYVVKKIKTKIPVSIDEEHIYAPSEKPVEITGADNDSGRYAENSDEREIYVLKRYDGEKEIPITIGKNDDNAIVLYKKD